MTGDNKRGYMLEGILEEHTRIELVQHDDMLEGLAIPWATITTQCSMEEGERFELSNRALNTTTGFQIRGGRPVTL